MLAIEVEMLTGRYVATAFDDRDRPEWPPHPARFFSALVAAHFDSLEPSNEERSALEWLEGQGPPVIAASEASERGIATVFVPVNDTSAIRSFDDEARGVDEARALLQAVPSSGRARSGAERKLAKAEARFAEAVRKGIAPVIAGKEGKGGPARAASLLPERRVRQPRTFPSVTPVDPRVIFSWPVAEPSPTQRAALDALAARVVRLGHSSSLVMARVCDRSCPPTWIPDEIREIRGNDYEQMLRVVGTGQLKLLCSAFEQQPDAPGRVMPASFQRYVRPDSTTHSSVSLPVFGQDWIVLRRIDGPRLPSTRAVDIARTVRRALLASYGKEAPENPFRSR